MRGHLKRLAICTLAVALATPASLAFAAGPSGNDDTRKNPATRTSPTLAVAAAEAPAAPATVRETASGLSGRTWRAAVARATAVAAEQTAIKGAARPASSRARAQYGGGGGGKGALVMTLVTTVVSLGLTFYMLKYLRDQQAASNEGGEN
jgi:hypothetical protein